jgi:antitoxin component of MazEF toxin-antitoxin module
MIAYMQEAIVEITTTAVGKEAASTTNFFASLRIVLPMPIVRQWNLREGDKLDWSWEVRNNEMFVVIRRRRVGQQTTDSSRGIILKRSRQVNI